MKDDLNARRSSGAFARYAYRACAVSTACAALALAAAASPARAQAEGRYPYTNSLVAPGYPVGAASMQRPQYGGPDPLVSDEMALLLRPEVQYELSLNLNQRDALEQLQNAGQAQLRAELQGTLQGINRRTLRSLPPAQRQEEIQRAQQEVAAAREAWHGQLSAEVAKILTPAQTRRLHQLDLQRRGPMSMADGKVADEAKLSPEHRAAIQKIEGEYRTATDQVVREAMQARSEQIRQLSQNGDVRAPQQVPYPDFTSPLSPLKRKLDKIRADAEAATLATLSPEETAGWKAAIGPKFTFRQDQQTL